MPRTSLHAGAERARARHRGQRRRRLIRAIATVRGAPPPLPRRATPEALGFRFAAFGSAARGRSPWWRWCGARVGGRRDGTRCVGEERKGEVWRRGDGAWASSASLSNGPRWSPCRHDGVAAWYGHRESDQAHVAPGDEPGPKVLVHKRDMGLKSTRNGAVS
jgi:hypothetical protein